MPLTVGAIADDFTGATDLASMLARGGLRTALQLGKPDPGSSVPEVEAVVVALKSRTAAVGLAIEESLESWRWLKGGGAAHCYFKYCSTFDSTPAGNIGPVAEALLAATGADQTIYTPAFPENARSIYKGKLFVGEMLLSETGMRNHPLTPMTDSDLVRVLGTQLTDPETAGLVPWDIVRDGAEAIADRLAELLDAGRRHVVVDGLTQADLDALAMAVRDFKLVTAGSGLGLSLARVLAGGDASTAETLPAIGGPAILLSGSCSEATNAQVRRWQSEGGAIIALDPYALAAKTTDINAVAEEALAIGSCLITSTQNAEGVAAVQATLGADHAADVVETALAQIARTARDRGVRRFVVAGGETSGAVAHALGATRLAVGPSIAPGVPWCATVDEDPIAITLKSGNFGAETFFADALASAP